jgi:ATP-dependent DNA ligase
MARRDPLGILLITRRGNDWTQRYPLVAEAVNHLKVRSRLIDGKVACCDARGVAAFQLLRHRRNEPQAFLYASDLLELNGDDLRREPIEVRKATLASILRQSRHGVRLNEHLEHDRGLVFQHACNVGREGIVSKRFGVATGTVQRIAAGRTILAFAADLLLIAQGVVLCFLVGLPLTAGKTLPFFGKPPTQLDA